jgi:hypothetical protein
MNQPITIGGTCSGCKHWESDGVRTTAGTAYCPELTGMLDNDDNACTPATFGCVLWEGKERPTVTEPSETLYDANYGELVKTEIIGEGKEG